MGTVLVTTWVTRIFHALNSQALEMGKFSFSPLPLGFPFLTCKIRLGEEKDRFNFFVGFDHCLLCKVIKILGPAALL